MNLKISFLGLLACLLGRAYGNPTVNTQPVDQSVSIGADAGFSLLASGVAPVDYRWQLDASPIPNATNRTLNFTNAALSMIGSYSCVVMDANGSVTSRVARLDVDPAFTMVRSGPVATDLVMAVQGSWGDYDNDGWIDLFVAVWNQAEVLDRRNKLYHNNGDGTFSTVTNIPLVTELGNYGIGVWADLDNDGRLDLFVGGREGKRNVIWRNAGGGSFQKNELPTATGINFNYEAGAWADYDGDGFVDLYTAVEQHTHRPYLFHNQGDGTFVQITNSALTVALARSSSLTWSDYNGDGKPDVFVTNFDNENCFLFKNEGAGVFRRIGSSPVVGYPASSIGSDWGDYDNDGYPDLFVSNGADRGSQNNRLYHNQGGGVFASITNSIVATDGGYSTHAMWGDYDNDGFLDLFVCNLGSLQNGRNGYNYLYHNNGDGTFAKITTGSLVNDKADSSGCSWADYDNDGFLDLYVANSSFGAPVKSLLYHNNGNTNGWLKVKCVGSVSNRSGIGAKVRLRAVIRGKEMWQMREISGNGSGGQNGLLAHFGLGDAASIEVLRIEWPSGIVQELASVSMRQQLTVVEPSRIQMGSAGEIQVKGRRGVTDSVEVTEDFKTWTPLGTRTNYTGAVTIADPDFASGANRFYRAVEAD